MIKGKLNGKVMPEHCSFFLFESNKKKRIRNVVPNVPSDI